MYNLKIASLNINGLNQVVKQIKLDKYLKHKGIQIAALQEHNIKSKTKLEYLDKFYHVILNNSIQLKGGTLILIDKRLPTSIGQIYLHPTSRITTAILTIFNIKLYIVNMYAPSGRNKETEREALFSNELTRVLIPNTDNVILTGDWNCVLSTKDTSNPANACISKSLKSIVTNLKLNDIYSGNNMQSEFTYYQNNYASRLDRIYLNKLSNYIQEVKTSAVSFSDHLCVSVNLQISTQIEVGRPLWKLNTSLLDKILNKENFRMLWYQLRGRKRYYQHTSLWWENLVKPQIKSFFAFQGKEENRFKYGTLKYLEVKLRKQYEISNSVGVINKDTIDTLKNRIDNIRDDMAKGVKIRTRLQDAICGENISNYLIAKQKEIASRKIITHITTDNNVELKTYKDIQQYATSFYKTLYSKSNCNIDKQNQFLSYITNGLTDAGRAMLSVPLSKEEIRYVMQAICFNSGKVS